MKLLFKILILFYSCFGTAQNIQHSVYLIGDAGEHTTPGDALLILKKKIELNENSTVLFLGDNVYPEGLHLKDTNSILRLKSQLQVIKGYKGNVFFIPGNHDWAAQKRQGFQRVLEQQNFIQTFIKDSCDALNKNGASFLPQNALPGPQSLLIANGVRIIFIDTQWFLHFHKKNKMGTIKKTKTYFYSSLDSLLNYSKIMNEQVIIAAHHPLYSNGYHSGNKQPFRFLISYTPFKIFGWMGLDRLFSQDIVSPRYKKMRKQLLGIFEKYNNILYVSGHDHNIQYFKVDNNKYIVSGSGSKLKSLNKKRKFKSVYESDDKIGFVKIIFDENKNQKIEVYKAGEEPVFIEK